MKNRTKGILLLAASIPLSFLPARLLTQQHAWWSFVAYMWSSMLTIVLIWGAISFFVIGDSKCKS
jgi:hypothetical protein